MPDGVRVWYKLAGRAAAPVIAYLHGGPGYNAYAFEKSAGRLLEETFRVLYIDQRGCGRSGFDGVASAYGMANTVEDIERIRVATGVDTLVVMGHSFGGVVAAEYARRFSKRVTAVVLLDTAPAIGRALAHQVEFIDRIAETDFAAKAAEVHAVARGAAPAFSKLQKLYGLLGRVPLQRRLHFASAARQEEMAALDAASGIMPCTSGEVVQAFDREGYLDDRPGAASRLPVRSLLLAGRASEVIGKDNVDDAARTWGAELRWLEETGHFVYFEKPREFADAVSAFLVREGRAGEPH